MKRYPKWTLKYSSKRIEEGLSRARTPTRTLSVLQIEVCSLRLDILALADLSGTVPVASLQKKGTHNIVKSSWVLDCLDQRGSDAGLPDLILPIEPR